MVSRLQDPDNLVKMKTFNALGDLYSVLAEYSKEDEGHVFSLKSLENYFQAALVGFSHIVEKKKEKRPFEESLSSFSHTARIALERAYFLTIAEQCSFEFNSDRRCLSLLKEDLQAIADSLAKNQNFKGFKEELTPSFIFLKGQNHAYELLIWEESHQTEYYKTEQNKVRAIIDIKETTLKTFTEKKIERNSLNFWFISF